MLDIKRLYTAQHPRVANQLYPGDWFKFVDGADDETWYGVVRRHKDTFTLLFADTGESSDHLLSLDQPVIVQGHIVELELGE